jgi:sugar phosphate isomerase/epimerase
VQRDIPLVSIGFDGYSLEDTLKGISKIRSREVCLCAVDGFTQHVTPESMSRAEWKETKLLFEKYGLNFYGLEGHCDVSNKENMPKLRKRIEFTNFMMGKYIDVNAGPKGSERNFFKNIGEIIELADEYDLLIFLETHGDIIKSGKNGKELLKKINSPRIKICYDPANVYFYSNGDINPIEDVEDSFEFIGMIHFKGVTHNQNKSQWSFPLMASSIFNYEEFFQVLKEHRYVGMIALELEKQLRFNKKEGFINDPGWTVAEIVEAYNAEIEYLENRLAWMLDNVTQD